MSLGTSQTRALANAASSPRTAAGDWRMPAETALQERVWMAFPPRDTAATRTDAELGAARDAWSAVANTIVDHEPVTMVVDPTDLADARRALSGEIEILQAPLDDAWMRDIGPSFVVDRDGEVAAVSWVFNGWGQQDWARWGADSRIAETVAAHAGVAVISSSLVNEGGGVVVDGRGTAFLTETVQLDPDRNPSMTHAMVEAELARTLGVTHSIWLPRGLYRDAQPLGTRGHVDMILAIPSPGRLLVHAQHDRRHPDHLITREIIQRLADAHDATGRSWEIVELPAPVTLRDRDGWVDFNYINHLVVNDAVIACRFADPADDRARGLLAENYPGREVITLDARAIFACGGGIHCITQQQPRSPLSLPGDRS